MNSVEIIVECVPPDWANPAEIENFALAVLDRLGKTNWSLPILFCDNDRIRDLNREFRDTDESTDVLSFTLGSTDGSRFLPGDIAISLETVAENARYFGVPPAEEVRRLIIHGILHLDGMDHSAHLSPSPSPDPMLSLQEFFLKQLF